MSLFILFVVWQSIGHLAAALSFCHNPLFDACELIFLGQSGREAKYWLAHLKLFDPHLFLYFQLRPMTNLLNGALINLFSFLFRASGPGWTITA